MNLRVAFAGVATHSEARSEKCFTQIRHESPKSLADRSARQSRAAVSVRRSRRHCVLIPCDIGDGFYL